jgi:hypothetical protein
LPIKGFAPTGQELDSAVYENDVTSGDGGGNTSCGISVVGLGRDPMTGFAGGHDCDSVFNFLSRDPSRRIDIGFVSRVPRRRLGLSSDSAIFNLYRKATTHSCVFISQNKPEIIS